MLPYIIGAAVAVLLLVVIHFFGLRLRQKLDFSHLQFLKALISKTRSVRKINNYLLLLVRTAFVLSGLAAFLLYYYNQGTTSGAAPVAKVVVDSSWSMQSRFSGGVESKAERAAQDANALLRNAQTGRQQSTQQAPKSNSVSARPDFSSAQDLVNQLGVGERNSQVYLLSDFQKSTFTPALLASLPKGQQFVLVPYSASATSNLFIDSVWLQVPILLPGKVADLSVRVAGSLLTEEKQVRVSATQAGKLVGATQTLLKPSQKATLSFKVPLTQASEQQIIFTLEDEATPFDNQFYAVLPKPAAIGVKLLVRQTEKHPVVNAFKAEPGFQLTASSAAADAQVLVVEMPEANRKPSLPPGLKTWLTKGGTLILVPAAGPQGALLQVLKEVGLQGISEEAKELAAKPLKQPDFSDAFFRSIFEKEVKNMRMPSLTPVVTWKSAAHTILKFQDNTPFLSSFALGQGRVHLFSAPLLGSGFVSHPLFVPVLYQLALPHQAVAGALAHHPNTLTVSLTAVTPSKQPYLLRRNGQEFVPDQRVVQQQLIMTLPAELNQPGLYELVREGRVLQQLAINIPMAESDLTGYTVPELQQLVKDHGGIQVLERGDGMSWQKQTQKAGNSSSLWKYCLILCFLCLLVEAFILSTKKRGSLI